MCLLFSNSNNREPKEEYVRLGNLGDCTAAVLNKNFQTNWHNDDIFVQSDYKHNNQLIISRETLDLNVHVAMQF